MKNRLIALGVGPGDPELVTVKAVRLMKEADIIIVPQSDKTGRSVAKEIIKPYVPDEKMHMNFFPMTGDKKDLDKRYTELAGEIAEMLKENKKVCYVTIGDTPLYSTFNYLASKLMELGFESELTPGIAAYSAAANRAAVTLCEKDESMCIIEMPEDAEKLAEKLKDFATVIVMKVHKKLPALKEFVKNSELKHAILASRVSMEDEFVIDMKKEDAPEEAGYLSTAILRR